MTRAIFLAWTSLSIAALNPLPIHAASGNALNDAAQAEASNQPFPQAKAGEFQGRPVLSAIPKNPKGLVFLFHGSGGTVRFAQRNETTAAFKPLAGLGYGWAASQSAQREAPTRWLNADADLSSNADLSFMLAFYRNLVETGQISKDTPVFTMGMSNGGGFATLFANVALTQGVPVKAVANYMGTRPATVNNTMLPQIFFVLAPNDGIIDLINVQAAITRARSQGAKITEAWARPRPVAAETFSTIASLSPAQRAQLVVHLQETGVIDPHGLQRLHAGKPLAVPELTDIAKNIPDGADKREILNALIIAFAGHQMRSDFASQQADFFEAALKR
jgi:poly(3-hydroxybutyrate) depolymerase